ncbi:MAG TPA: glycosyltransferase, partial [Acetobacteraceae bacterium]|nr:glycosyltransferase [Acetobacteraceae bacterium]
GVAKGYDVLLACARDAAWRNLPLDFVVVGHTIDDRRLLATGRAFITGHFHPDEATALIRAQGAALALLPSIVPETWCYALSDAWQAGLAVAAFDIGAQAERIRRTGRGFLLPLGLPAPRINNALLAAASQSVHVCRHRPEADARIADPPSLRALRTPNRSESLNARTRPRRRRHPAGAPAKPG